MAYKATISVVNDSGRESERKTARGAVVAAFNKIRYRVTVTEGDTELFLFFADGAQEAASVASSMIERLKRRYK